MQTPREVIGNLYTSGPADRYGLRDSPWHDTLEKWVSQGYPTGADGAPVAAADHFGFDMVGCGGWFPWKAKLEEDVTVEQSEEWKLLRDGNGATFKWWKHKSGTPEHVDFAMTSRKVWEDEYKPHVVGSVRQRATSEAVAGIRASFAEREVHKKWMDIGLRGLWENMRAAFGDTSLYESMLLDPDWIRDYCRTYTDLYKQEITIVLEEAGQPDGAWFFDDLGYKGATFCSPALYAELIFPFYDELVDFCHEGGMPVTLHTCGYTEPVLDLIVEAGFDGVNPMEVKAGNEILRAADSYGEDLVFVGGLDARVLESGDRDYIEKEVRTLILGLQQRGARFVFGSDHSLSTLIDYQDFCFAVDLYRELADLA